MAARGKDIPMQIEHGLSMLPMMSAPGSSEPQRRPGGRGGPAMLRQMLAAAAIAAALVALWAVLLRIAA